MSYANFQLTFQILQELHVFKDHLLLAIHVPKDNQMTDIHVLTAQLDKFKIQTTAEYAMLQFALVCTIFNLELTIDHVENAKHATGHKRFQTTRKLLVLEDHMQTALAALKDNQMTDIHVSNAHTDRLKIQPIRRDVLLLPALGKDKSNNHLTQLLVEDVLTVIGHRKCLMSQKHNVFKDQNLFVIVMRNIQPMDIHVKNAQLDLLEVIQMKKYV